MSRFWHPFADMKALGSTGPVVIDRAEGYYVFDVDGKRYLDATASLWYCNVGHGRTSIVEAARAQMARLEAYSTFGDLANGPILELAERLGDISPVADSVAFFTSGGSDSIDTAVKLARRYWQVVGQPERRVVISRSRAYHGMHVAGTGIAGIDANVDGYGRMFPDVARVEWDSYEELEAVIEDLGAERIAAFVCEPIIGAVGVLAPPPGYLEKARAVCRDAGVLFIADEVVTGFGRTGYWFASERFDLQPDMIVCAKGITSGYLPMGALIVSPEVAEPWFAGDVGMWRHGYTYSGHATVAAAALANLDVLEDEQLVVGAKTLESDLASALAPLAEHDLVSGVRAGTGVLAAVQLEADAVADDPALPGRVIAGCRTAGIMSRLLLGDAIHVSPPLTLDGSGLTELRQGIRAGLDLAAAG